MVQIVGGVSRGYERGHYSPSGGASHIHRLIAALLKYGVGPDQAYAFYASPLKHQVDMGHLLVFTCCLLRHPSTYVPVISAYSGS
jgi:hypothetical protein